MKASRVGVVFYQEQKETRGAASGGGAWVFSNLKDLRSSSCFLFNVWEVKGMVELELKSLSIEAYKYK